MEPFGTIVTLLEKISASGSVAEKEAQLRRFLADFESVRQRRQGPSGAEHEDRSIYPTLRLLLPGLDRERKAYGLREKTLADAYMRALGLARGGRRGDADPLLPSRATGDLADRLVPLLRGRCPAEGTLTVAEVNRRLDALATGGRGVQGELSQLLEHGAPLDHRWLVRIVLRNLRLGHPSGRRILQLYHPSAPGLYDATGDLRHVVQLLEQANDAGGGGGGGGDVSLADVETGALIRLGHFVRPMLCQRVELRQVGDLLARHAHWLETKMDGERFQVHKDGDRFRYLSRNGLDYSATFGATAAQLDGTLTPMLAELLPATARSLVLDGEMMLFDRRTLRYRDKCDGGADVKALRPGHAELRACFCAYDVLLLNGRPLTELPYGERARLLATLLPRDQLGFVTRCRPERVRDGPHLVALLNAAIDARQEGVVLKREDAPYRPNRRAGAGWYKIKPDYIAGLVTDFDLLIVGAFYNARRTAVNALLVGALAADAPDRPFLPVVKVAMGLSAAQWAELNRSLRPHWREATGDGRRWGRAGPPDVCIEPAASLVLQLKGSELVRSDAYAAGYTIRFPRIVAIRSDKLPDEVCTVAELEGLARAGADRPPGDSEGQPDRRATKLAKRHVTLDDLAPQDGPDGGGGGGGRTAKGGGRRRQLTVATTGTPYAADHHRADDEGGLLLLRGRDICVMGASGARELEELVRRHGGRPVANPGTGTFAIVVAAGAADTFRVRKYIAAGRWDVVRADWLQRLAGGAARGDPLPEPFRPADMLGCTAATRLALAEAFDRHGDSYTRPVSPTTFAALLRWDGPGGAAELPRGLDALTERELAGAERTLLGRGRLFRGLAARLYLPPPEPEGAPPEQLVAGLRAQRQLLRFVRHGGRWLRDTDPGPATHVFFAGGDGSADVPAAIARWLQSLGAIPDPDAPAPAVLSVDWIGRALDRGQLCDVAEFAFT